MSDLIIKCNQSATQVLLLTAAIRDIHRSLPGMFRTDVRTPYHEFWENNPYLTSLDESSADICIECRNPLIQCCNELPLHSVHTYVNEINERLAINVRPTGFSPDIHLSAQEKASEISDIDERLNGPYWILNAGTNRKRTVKQWDPARFQQIVNHYRGKIQFVQIGLPKEDHPTLENVIDLRGKTSIRELLRLMYHADGVVTSSGLLAHLAAAVESKNGRLRSCVIVAGGRESAHWNAYPGQRYLNTIGMLPCCRYGGCWRSRTVPIGDGEPEDNEESRCINSSNGIAHCMDMIDVTEVRRNIDQLHSQNASWTGKHAQMINPPGFRELYEVPKNLSTSNALREQENFIQTLGSYPGGYTGRGIVICAGGSKMLANAWVCINMLRHLGCHLPIQIWHTGPEEKDEQFKSMVAHLNVQCIDALEIHKRYPIRRLGGWEVKPFAILHCSFEEVMLLDADNVPVVNPEFLFDIPQFQDTGAIFWPDFGHLRPAASIWKLCGVPYRDEPEWETGQIVVNKQKCWRPLSLALWYNEHSNFYYQHILGDKETFHMAFRRLDHPVSMPDHAVRALHRVLCQHDFDGRRIFQHRTSKWKYLDSNERVPGFLFETECLSFLQQFREQWNETENLIARINLDKKTVKERDYILEIVSQIFEYVRVGYDRRVMTFSVKGCIETGRGGCEKYWDLREDKGVMVMEISNENGVICQLTEHGNGDWRGRWLHFERMPVELRRVRPENSSVDTTIFNRPVFEEKQILFRAPINGYTGYGLHAIQIVRNMTKMGYEMLIRATHLNEAYAPIPADVRKQIVCRNISKRSELILSPPAGYNPRSGVDSLFFTMWESTRISPEAVLRLNQATQIVVPCLWNALCFNACGVNRPIEIVPLGINSEVFSLVPMNLDGPCIFGTAGRMESGGMRKGIPEVVRAFQEAFSDNPDVRLRIKIFPDDELPDFNDERIEVIGQYLTETELAKWFSDITCFVSYSHGEAWGLMLHQSLAVGRPVISPVYGGVAEFFNEEMGYPVGFRLVPAQGFYEGFGLWAEPNRHEIVDQMRLVFGERDKARDKGLKASKSVSRLTWENSNVHLLKVMKKMGMVS